MRSIEIKLYSFDELSESAQEKAYKKWLVNDCDEDCIWDGELRDALKVIESKTGVSLRGWEYDRYSYNYRIGDLEMLMRPEFDSYNFEHDVNAAAEPRGIRAGKIALEAYYDLVESKCFYGKTTGYLNELKFGYYEEKYLSLTQTNRLSAFTKVEDCFTGHCLSYSFSEALKRSVRDNYTNKDYTVEYHLKNAFDALFESICSDYDHQFSFEAYSESYCHDCEYLANGEVFELSEDTEAM